MEDKFYVAYIFHRKRFKSFMDQMVLYSEDYYSFLEPINGIWYTTDTTNKDYVIRDSIKPIDVQDCALDYMYLTEANMSNAHDKPKSRKRNRRTTG